MRNLEIKKWFCKRFRLAVIEMDWKYRLKIKANITTMSSLIIKEMSLKIFTFKGTFIALNFYYNITENLYYFSKRQIYSPQAL